MNRLFALGVAAAVVAVPRVDARACDAVGELPHMVVTSMQATDQTAPVLPVIPAPLVHRADDSSQGNGCGGAKCGDATYVAIPALATDDTTAPERIGYRLSLESGSLPPSLVLPTIAIDPIDHFVRVYFNKDTGAFDFTLQVVAIDLAGNESAPQSVHIESPPSTACSVAGGRASRAGLGWIALLALIVTAGRRRRGLVSPGARALRVSGGAAGRS